MIYEKEIKLINDDIKMKKKTISPFIHASLIDDPQQKNITELYLKENYLAPSKSQPLFKITIGYFSAEFYNHPLMHLIFVFKNLNLIFMDSN